MCVYAYLVWRTWHDITRFIIRKNYYIERIPSSIISSFTLSIIINGYIKSPFIPWYILTTAACCSTAASRARDLGGGLAGFFGAAGRRRKKGQRDNKNRGVGLTMRALERKRREGWSNCLKSALPLRTAGGLAGTGGGAWPGSNNFVTSCSWSCAKHDPGAWSTTLCCAWVAVGLAKAS